MKPRILDLFCCEGGAGTGYARAGFDVVGVDINPQPRYPFPFVQADVLDVLDRLTYGLPLVDGVLRTGTTLRLSDFAAIHASPPCQFGTVYGNNTAHVRNDHPNLIPQTRELLQATGLPYVIENVEGVRRHLINPVRICGTGLDWCRVRRHRHFEANWPIEGVSCDHGRYTIRFFPGSSNRPNGRTVMNVGEYRVPLRLQRKVVKMPWASLYGISQAVPPAYTAHIGRQLGEFVTSQAVRRAA